MDIVQNYDSCKIIISFIFFMGITKLGLSP
jgi:hypothetical protein